MISVFPTRNPFDDVISGANIHRPPALCRKPVFGDREQIRAIYRIERLLEESEANRLAGDKGDEGEANG